MVMPLRASSAGTAVQISNKQSLTLTVSPDGIPPAFIEVFYNRQRRHQSLDFISPIDYERNAGVH